jgi:hypothetical protein
MLRRSSLASWLVASSWIGGLGAVGCDSPPGTDESFATQSPFAEGTREARAVVAFVNDPATDSERLKAAGVTQTATANRVLARRNGKDGTPGTADDLPFDTLASVDAVKGVGPATLRSLSTFAVARGFGNERGFYAGVYLTERQADRVLELVNVASIDELDAETSVDSRALDNIEAARPILSLAELTGISRVKATALRLLRERADAELGAPTCSAEQTCEAGLFCTGFEEFGSGRCVKTADLPGEGLECSSEGVCGAGLVCAGRGPDFAGLCNPAWMRDEFLEEVTASLPDGPSDSIGFGVPVWGLATVPTDAVVRVVIDHPRPADLVLTLENPSGTSVPVWSAADGPLPRAPEGIPVRVPGDEGVLGTWTLTVRDTVSGQTGMLSFFSIELTSRWD